MINTILREPLVHFLALGAALFLIYSSMDNTVSIDENKITISKSQIDTLVTKFVNAKGKEPSSKEKKELLDRYIKEEVLYREAIAKGLDKNDDTIRLHLAKKMEFVLDDLSVIPKPSDTDLETFLKNNADTFKGTPIVSFNQVVFTKAKDSTEANNFLTKLKKSTNSKKSTIGDKVELNQKTTKTLFGDEFSKKIFSLPIHTWQGPLKTKHGLHLVYIHSRTNKTIPTLSQVRTKVEAAWKKKKQEEANKIFYDDLSKNYNVVLPK